MDLFFDSYMLNPLLKPSGGGGGGGGGDRRLNFVGRQLFSDLVRYHT